MNDMTQTQTPADLVELYISLRNERQTVEKEFEEAIRIKYGEPMLELEHTMLDLLNGMGIDSISSPRGTVYKKVMTSVTIADAREFRRHVIGSEAWNLLDWRANKTAVNELIESGEALPPGLNRNQTQGVGFRKKS